ncbi:MAG: hypothetical protein AB7U85_04470 [Alphaproteobacteria bacterium]
MSKKEILLIILFLISLTSIGYVQHEGVTYAQIKSLFASTPPEQSFTPASVFARLKYSPRWNEIPNVAEVKKYFFDATKYDFDEMNVFCNDFPKMIEEMNKNYLFVSNDLKKYLDARRKNWICQQNVTFEKLTYKNYGKPMNCLRSDFVRAIIEEGSSWLLERKWRLYSGISDRWFWNKNLYKKDLSEIDPEFPIDQIDGIYNPKLWDIFEMPSLMHPLTDNTLVCYAVAASYDYMVSDPDFYFQHEKELKIAQINGDYDMVEKCSNFDKNRLYFSDVSPFSDDVTPSINYIPDEKKEDPVDSQSYFFKHSRFFKFKHKKYLFNENKGYVYLLGRNECKKVCSTMGHNTEFNKPTPNMIKAYAASVMTIQHVNENVPLYDQSFADEIKERAKGKDKLANEIETYLKQKVKDLCGTDLDKLETTE